MIGPQINPQTVLLSAYHLLKTKDEFGVAQLLGALLLLSQRCPDEMRRIPQRERHQTVDHYLESLLTKFKVEEAADTANSPSLADIGLNEFSFRRPLRGLPPTTNWSEMIEELCSVMTDLWSSKPKITTDYGHVFSTVLLSRPGFVRAFTPTPPAAAQLAAQLLQVRPGQEVLNVQCRWGQVLLALNKDFYGDQAVLMGSGSDMQALSVCALLLLISKVETAHLRYIPLSADAPLLGFKEEFYDRVVAHPPVEAPVGQARQYIEELVIGQVMGTLKPGGRAVIIVSGGYLHRSRPEPVIRRRLIAEDWLRAVVQLPGTTKDSGGSPSLLVLDRSRANQAVVFVDLSEVEPNDWLQSDMVNRVIEAPNEFSDERWTALSAAAGPLPNHPRWQVVPRAEIAVDANLSPARYLQSDTNPRMTRSGLLKAREHYQVASSNLQQSIQKFDQLMQDLFEPQHVSDSKPLLNQTNPTQLSDHDHHDFHSPSFTEEKS
ncbi:hypothetical protein EHF33_20320 (plasmid) [Deinococcus psychrotolerans]|uniref:site-specific DNA-methyltransferase (adenine-specific) n=1 Tax=Deinococcus psychrotolerans TaxID=2489213 RepID=A0A3G8YK28_9DEIO|nr:N-6 DNA methylase [Deinococcus psychrotolerans]AZI45255.1 hypothetical protein EHF33_20320 [Deinococcus psychrotolerans]